METNKTFCSSFLVGMTQKVGTRLGRYLGMLLIPLMSMLATNAWATDDSGTCGDNLTWSFDSGTGTLTITGSGATYDYASEGMGPWSSYATSIKKVVISGENITIGNNAFNELQQLETVEMSGVTAIGNNAFYECKSLTAIDLSTVKSIGTYAFMFCSSLTNVKLSECEAIGDEAFWMCTNLESAEMPKVTSLGTQAFYATNLKTVALPNVTTIGSSVFWDCTNLTSVDLSKMTIIGESMFYGCTGLTTVDLPNVTTIGNRAFYGCTNLSSVTNLKVTSLPTRAFSNCTSLADIDLSDVTTIDQMAFSNCTSLSSVDLSSVTSVDTAAFALCTSLSSVDLSSVTSVGYAAFGYCTSLTDVDLSSATSVGEMSFYECAGLKSVILNGNATLGNSAFAKDTKLTSVVVTPSTSAATWGDAVFDGSSLGMLIFAGTTLPSYTDDTKTLYEAISLPTSTKVFYPITDVTAYTTAFADQGSDNLIPITQHDKASATCDKDGYAAKGWYSTDEDVLVNSAYKIYSASDSILAKGTVSGSCGEDLTWSFSCGTGTLTISGTGEMVDCTQTNQPWKAYINDITNVVFSSEKNDITIGTYAFCNYANLKTVDLSGVKEIKQGAFAFSGLTSVDLSKISVVGIQAFDDCYYLTSVLLNGNATLSSWTFGAATISNLVVTPGSTNEWPSDIFDGCDLSKLIFTGTVPPTFTYSKDVFYEVIPTVYYPSGSESAYKSIFGSDIVPITLQEVSDATCEEAGYKAAGWYSEEENGIYVNSTTYQVLDASPYIVAATGHDFSSQTLAENEDGTYSYVCANDESHKSGVFIKDYDGNGNNLELSVSEEGNYSVESFELKDGVAFSSPVDFTVNTLTYDRKANASIITFILPFDMDASILNGSAYILHTFNGKTLSYSPVTELEANTPYVLKVANLNESLFEKLTDVTVKKTSPIEVTAEKATQFGKYSREIFYNNEDYDFYGYTGGKFYRAKKGVAVSPFRTAIKLSLSSGAGNGKPHMNPEELDIVFEDEEATGIETVSSELGLNGKVNVYDALGRAVRLNVEAEGCLDGLQNGIYIVNGKKIVVRN